VLFPGDREPTWIYRNLAELDRELAVKWGEKGEVEAFRADEARVVSFLQDGYVNATPPSIDEAKSVLGDTLTDLWISGSAKALLDHYFTSERGKIYMAMTVTESSPVSLSEPYSAFTLPLMDSGSVFGGYYGFVKGGIWRITEELGRINAELGTQTHLSSMLTGVDTANRQVTIEQDGKEQRLGFDFLILGTDPLTAARLVGTEEQLKKTEAQRFRGSSGKLNLMFRNPVSIPWRNSRRRRSASWTTMSRMCPAMHRSTAKAPRCVSSITMSRSIASPCFSRTFPWEKAVPLYRMSRHR
jgi:phytoene dehydrogenase-like protein